MKEITRIGVYGLIIEKNKVLLTTKTKGPYKNCLDLPGGKIEFNETIEDALRREFKEEVALSFSKLSLINNYTYSGSFYKEGYIFHHIGLIYKVDDLKKIPNCKAEDIFDWYLINKTLINKLTPFAKIAVENRI